MKYTRIYSDENNLSAFEDCEMELPNENHSAFYTDILGAKGLEFVVANPAKEKRHDGWHNPPVKQFVILLSGSFEIECGSGDKRIFGPGDILLVEDLAGKGHITRDIDGEIRRVVVVRMG